MRESFGASPDEDLRTTLKDNSKLKAEVAAAEFMHVSSFPSLYVNGTEYKVILL